MPQKEAAERLGSGSVDTGDRGRRSLGVILEEAERVSSKGWTTGSFANVSRNPRRVTGWIWILEASLGL